MAHGHSSQGYILPCCFWDKPNMFDGEIKDLLQEKFKLENIFNIRDLFESEEWKAFYNRLESNDPPDLCKYYCSGTFATKLTEEQKIIQKNYN